MQIDRSMCSAKQHASHSTDDNGRDLAQWAAYQQYHEHRDQGDAGTLAVGTKVLGHAPYGMRHNGHRGDLQAVNDTLADGAVEHSGTQTEQYQDDGGG